MAKKFVQNKGNIAFCYYRYSSSVQRDCSIEQQRDAAHKLADEHGYIIEKEYEDRAISGTRDDRPGLQMMLFDIQRLRPAYLILWKVDRLARDKELCNEYKRVIKNAGCKIVYVAEYVPDSDDGSAVILESVYEAMAQMFIEQHRKNVSRGLNHNAVHCLYNGQKLLGYIGEPNNPYKIDPATAIVVQKIYEKYAEGVSMKEIIDDLKAKGIKSSRGNDFTINSLRTILHNEAYKGIYRYGEVRVEDGMPRLVSDELFEKVQKRFASNKQKGNKLVKELHPEIEQDATEYWLTGHIRCGYCGSSLCGMSGTSKQGKLHYYYTCINRRKKTCDKMNITKDVLESVIENVLTELTNDSALRLIIARKCYEYHLQQNAGKDLYETSLRAQLKDVDNRLDNLLKAIEAGIFNETTAERMKELEEQKQLLVNELDVIETRKKYELTEESVLRFLDSYFNEKNISKALLLDSLIENIYVYDDKIVISMYYGDDKREINIEDTLETIRNRKKVVDILDSDNQELVGLESKFEDMLEPAKNKKKRKKSDSF